MNSALTLGFSMAVGMGVFAGLGWWLDRRRGSGVLWTTVGAGLGLLYIAYETWKVVREVNHEEVGSRKSEGGGQKSDVVGQLRRGPQWPEGTEHETSVAACLRQVAVTVTNRSPQPARDRHATARSAAATKTNATITPNTGVPEE